MVLDPVQLSRIEATHSGFLYQHLFAAAQLLLGLPDAEVLLVETDEDVEVRTHRQHWYAQVKYWADPLQPSDVSPILERFDQLREEHRSGCRGRDAVFVIVSASEPSPSLATLMQLQGWPADVTVVTPKRGGSVLGVPAWATLSEAVRWTIDTATRIPFCRLVPETLVWKLAAYIQAVASGRVYGRLHEIPFSELPRLREQLDLFADAVPPMPSPYRPQRDEPSIDNGSRVRLVVGVSGAGKTSWFSSASAHFTATVAFMRASRGIVDVASWLVRHLAATLLRNANETLSAVFRPGAVAEESLKLLDRLAERTPITVVVDNAHLVDSTALAACVRDTAHLRWILLAQPGPETNGLIGRLQLRPEELGGWTPQTIACVLGEFMISTSPELAVRVREVTAGLPLFVEGTARVAQEHYGGDLSRLLDDQSRGAHVAALPQETIMAQDVVRHLTVDARNVGALLALLRSDVSLDLVRGIATNALSLGARSPAAIRELMDWRILRPGLAGTVSIHDTFRPVLDAERLGMAPTVRESCLRFMLDAVQKIRAAGSGSVDLLLDSLRMLADLEDGQTLVDVIYGGIEWLSEYGAASEAELLLAEAQGRAGLSEKFQFLAADTLSFLAIQRGDATNAMEWIKVCERIAARQILASSDWEARLAVKRILLAGVTGNYQSAKMAYDEYNKWAAQGTEGYRVARYDLAFAAYKGGEHQEAIRLTSALISEYFQILNLSGEKLFGKNPRDLARELDVDGNEYEFRHLADSLYLRAMALIDNQEYPGFDPPWAMKLFALVGANSSAIRAGLEWADVMVRAGGISEGLKIYENQLVPLVESERYMRWIVPVYMGYARALVRAGRYADAKRRLQAVEVFASALSDEDRLLFENINKAVLAANRRLGGQLVDTPEGVRRTDRQRYDSFNPYRLPSASLLHEEVAWFERTDGSAIGIVARDKADNDYAWMVQREDGGQFRAADCQVSYSTPEEAAADLMQALLNPIDWNSAHDPDDPPESSEPPNNMRVKR